MFTPRRSLTKAEWKESYSAARLCRNGERKHGPVNMVANFYALAMIKEPV